MEEGFRFSDAPVRRSLVSAVQELQVLRDANLSLQPGVQKLPGRRKCDGCMSLGAVRPSVARYGRCVTPALGGHRGFRHSARNVVSFMEGRETRRGARLHACVVLRHPASQRRHVRGHGGGCGEDIAHPAGHRRSHPLKPHCAGGGGGARLAQRARARSHRFRRVHRVYRAPHHGAAGDSAGAARAVRSRRAGAASRRDDGMARGEGHAQSPVSQSGARAHQPR